MSYIFFPLQIYDKQQHSCNTFTVSIFSHPPTLSAYLHARLVQPSPPNQYKNTSLQLIAPTRPKNCEKVEHRMVFTKFSFSNSGWSSYFWRSINSHHSGARRNFLRLYCNQLIASSPTLISSTSRIHPLTSTYRTQLHKAHSCIYMVHILYKRGYTTLQFAYQSTKKSHFIPACSIHFTTTLFFGWAGANYPLFPLPHWPCKIVVRVYEERKKKRDKLIIPRPFPRMHTYGRTHAHPSAAFPGWKFNVELIDKTVKNKPKTTSIVGWRAHSSTRTHTSIHPKGSRIY